MKYIADLLPTGKANRITAGELMRATGITTKRELTAAVRQERLAGHLILSTKADRGGYYLPEDAAEVQEFLNTFSGEARSMFAMMRAAREFVKAAAGGA